MEGNGREERKGECRGSKEGEKATESVHSRLNVLCQHRLIGQIHDYALHEHPHESSFYT